MGEAIGLAASIVGIASAGVSVVSTLTKFGISFRGSNDKINSLAGRVSLTTSILSDIATTVEQNASGFKKEEFWKTWRKVLLSCEDGYGKLEKALLKARRSNTGKSKTGSDGMSVWGKLVWALGGETEMQDLETSLERCCDQVMVMQQAVQMSVLSLIAQRQKLSADEIEDQRELMSKLQWLLSTLSESGILSTGNSKGRLVIIVDETSPEPSKGPLTEDLSQGFDYTANGERLPPLTANLPPSGPGFGLDSFAVHAVLPQPKLTTRSPKLDSKLPTLNVDAKAEKQAKQEKHLFEAYYIIPRSVPRTQPRGHIQLTKPIPDDYMAICLDTKRDYRNDPNLRNALRRAKRAPESNVTSIVNQFPRTVQDAAFSLISHKKQANGMKWTLVEGVELRCLEESMFRKAASKAGFLVVFRENAGEPPPTLPGPLTSILKGSTNHQRNRSLPMNIEHDTKNDITGQESQVPLPALSNPLAVSFETSRKEKKKDGKAKEPSRPSSGPIPHPAAIGDSKEWSSTANKKGKGGKVSNVLVERNLGTAEEAKTDDILGTVTPKNDRKNGNKMPIEVVNEFQVEKRVAASKRNMRLPSAETRWTGDDLELSVSPDPFTDGAMAPGSSPNAKRVVLLSPHGPGHVKGPMKIHVPQESNQEETKGGSITTTGRPTFSQPETTITDDLHQDSAAIAPKYVKGKVKVVFQDAALLKSERPTTRPLPGPVLYDPARSKLIPSLQSSGERQLSMASGAHRRRSSALFDPTISPSEPRPAVTQRPQNSSPRSSYFPAVSPDLRPLSERFTVRPSISSSGYSSYSSEYTMTPLSSSPGWTASSRPSSSVRGQVTPPAQDNNTEYLSEKLQRAQADQRDVAGSPAMTGAKCKRYSIEVNSDDEDVTINVTGATPVRFDGYSEGSRAGRTSQYRPRPPPVTPPRTPPRRMNQYRFRRRPVIVDERPIKHRRRHSVSSENHLRRHHRRERIVMVESETERSRNLRILQQDEEVRRRPAVSLPPRSHLRPQIAASDDLTMGERKYLGPPSQRNSLPTGSYSSISRVVYELSGSEPEMEETDDERSYSRDEHRKAQAQLRGAEEQLLRAKVQAGGEAKVLEQSQHNPLQRSRENSFSRIRTGSATAGTGLARAAVAGLRGDSKANKVTEDEARHDYDSEPTTSDFSSESGDEDEDSTLVEEREEEGGEELHLTQSEAQAMMMNFLATFTTV